MPDTTKAAGLNRIWEYGVGVGLLSIATYVLWGKISDVEKKSDDCARTNVEILINQVEKGNATIEKSNEVNREVLSYIRQMPKYTNQ